MHQKTTAISNAKDRPARKPKASAGSKAIVSLDDAATLKDFCKDKVEEAFWESIPEPVKELPEPHMTRFAVLTLLISLLVFSMFTYNGFYGAISASFISLDPNAGICVPVPKSITSTSPYVASSTGYWKGDQKFYSSDSTYELTLSEFIGDNDDYKKMMEYFQKQLKKFSKIGSTKPATYNIALWSSLYMSYSTPDTDRNQVMRLSGSVDAIFAPYFSDGGLAGPQGLCNYQSTYDLNYDVVEKTFTMNFPRDYFTFPDELTCPDDSECTDPAANTSSETCHLIIEDFCFSNKFPDIYYDFTAAFKLDAQSFMTAYAVNMGILPYSALDSIEVPVMNKSTTDDDYYFDDNSENPCEGVCPNDDCDCCPAQRKTKLMFDPKYPSMAPIICLSPEENYGVALCAINFIAGSNNPNGNDGRGIALPLFHPVGKTEYDSPYPAFYFTDIDGQCPRCGETADFNVEQYCNENNFYLGFAIFNTVADLISIYRKYDNNYEAINNAGFNATFVAATQQKQYYYEYQYDMVLSSADLTKYPLYNHNNFYTLYPNYSPTLEESFAFCDSKCVVMAFRTLSKYTGLGLVVNEVFKQVGTAHCPPEDPSPLLDTKYFQNIINNPPETLTENYYECKTPMDQAFLDAIGIANGNTAAFVPIIVGLLLPVVYYWFRLIGYHPPVKEYTKPEKEEMAEALAVHLMRIRDGKSRSFNRDDAILKLFEELRKADKVPPGYPDSDDDDDDDDDGGGGGDDGGETGKGKAGKKSASSKSSSSVSSNRNRLTNGVELADIKNNNSNVPSKRPTSTDSSKATNDVRSEKGVHNPMASPPSPSGARRSLTDGLRVVDRSSFSTPKPPVSATTSTGSSPRKDDAGDASGVLPSRGSLSSPTSRGSLSSPPSPRASTTSKKDDSDDDSDDEV